VGLGGCEYPLSGSIHLELEHQRKRGQRKNRTEGGVAIRNAEMGIRNTAKGVTWDGLTGAIEGGGARRGGYVRSRFKFKSKFKYIAHYTSVAVPTAPAQQFTLRLRQTPCFMRPGASGRWYEIVRVRGRGRGPAASWRLLAGWLGMVRRPAFFSGVSTWLL
jgi:hypothetical protein